MKREQGKGGVDFLRYNQEVIVPLVIPFIGRLNSLPDLHPFVFQQDNVPSHISLEQQGYILHEHPGNSREHGRKGTSLDTNENSYYKCLE
jgi:hypothetical protein